MMQTTDEKQLVGYKAVDDYVRSGMVVGLGTGSTAKYAVERLGQKLKAGELEKIVGIPTSENTRLLAEKWGIEVKTLDEETRQIDLAIDGADEVDKHLNLVKGRGGALLREKLVEETAKEFVVVVDRSKIVSQGLGTTGAFPVEINPFCHDYIIKKIAKLSSLSCLSRAVLRTNANKDPYVTDNQNYIVDLFFDKPLEDPHKVAKELTGVVGVVEHGLFLGMATACLVPRPDGTVEVLSAAPRNA